MATKNAIYQVDNGVDFDEINFRTIAAQVFCTDGKTVEDSLEKMVNIASLGENGWFKDKKTGFIIQWGKDFRQDGILGTWKDYKVTFPIAFPNVCLNVSCTVLAGNRNGSRDIDAKFISDNYNVYNFMWSLYTELSNWGGISWMAIGR